MMDCNYNSPMLSDDIDGDVLTPIPAYKIYAFASISTTGHSRMDSDYYYQIVKKDVDALSPILSERDAMIMAPVYECSPKDHLSALPHELHLMIVGFLGAKKYRSRRKTLRSLRFFKAFREEATRFLFKTFTFRPHKEPHDWRDLVPFFFGEYVQTLNMATIEYAPDVETEDSESDGDVADPSSIGHYRQAYRVQNQLRDEHLEHLKARSWLPFLIVLLRSMPQLRKVVLTNEGGNGFLFDCELPGCPNSYEDHDRYLGPGPTSGLYELGGEHLEILMLALSITRAPIRKFKISGNDYYAGFKHTHFNLPAARMTSTLEVFSRLTSFDFVLHTDDGFMELGMLKGDTTHSSPIARLFSSATSLQHLRLDFMPYREQDYTGDLKTVLCGCHLPNLKSCVLLSWAIETTTFLDFLVQSRELQTLVLICCDTDENWDQQLQQRRMPGLTVRRRPETE
ncbi:MAG: hypothetical protein Q9168_004681 [Polycauliona sp. 1 TL-2023]